MESLNDFEIAVIKAMHSRKVYGSKHIRLEKIMKSGFMPHQYGESREAIESLLKKSLIIYAKRSKDAIQLNKEKLSEIYAVVRM
ncbi:hypothetical protein J4410_02480 [Candidatus Woesearchaeota archaeon]|nr:hypothetical protein [Candidatus Woesearchaeota archaeon]